MNRRALPLLVTGLCLAACARPAGVAASTAPPASTASPSPTSATTPPAQPVADCPGLQDNTSTPVTPFSPGTTVYYLFACGSERILVQVAVGSTSGGVVLAPLQSEYTFGTIQFLETGITVRSETGTVDMIESGPLAFYGTPEDLRATSLVRVVGPTADVADLNAQDCLDYKAMFRTDDCDAMQETSARYLREGAAAGWVNQPLN